MRASVRDRSCVKALCIFPGDINRSEMEKCLTWCQSKIAIVFFRVHIYIYDAFAACGRFVAAVHLYITCTLHCKVCGIAIRDHHRGLLS